jgi:hypothetical protein
MVSHVARLQRLEERSQRRALEEWKKLIREASVEDLARLHLAMLPVGTLAHEEIEAAWPEILGIPLEIVEATVGTNPSDEWSATYADEVARALVDERKPALLASMRRLDPERTEEILNRKKVANSEP